jgi:tetratricopeptide (TPR) repeat protein
MSCGEEIAGLMNNAIAAMIQGRLRLAEELFMSVAKQTNDAAQALMLLAAVRFDQGHFRDAIQTLTGLIDCFPRIPLYRINLANMLMNRYIHTDDKQVRQHVLSRAREQYEKAIELDDRSPIAYIEMAKTYLAEGKPEEAYGWTERAVKVDGREDFEDFQSLLYGYAVLAHGSDQERLHPQVLRIENVVPEHPGARLFAATAMIPTAIDLVRNRKFEAARLLFLSAARLSPELKDVKAMLSDCEMGIEADAVWERFEHDPNVIGPIKEMAERFFDHFMLRAGPDKLDQACRDFMQKLSTWRTIDINQSLRRMRKVYPAIWKMNPVFWDRLMHLSGGAAPGSAYSRVVGSGLLLVLTLVILLSWWLSCQA